MEKKYLLAVILSFLVLYAWSAVNIKTQKSKNINKQLQVIDNKEVTSLPPSPAPEIISEEIKQIKTEAVLESTKSIENSKIMLRFSNIGGNIKDTVLKDFNTYLPVSRLMSLTDYDNVEFQLIEKSDRKIVYSYDDERINIIKIYSLDYDSFIVQSEIEFTNKYMSNLNVPRVTSFVIGIPENTNGSGGLFGQRGDSSKYVNTINPRDKSLLEYVVYTNEELARKNNAFKFSEKERNVKDGKINWVGFRERYYCAIFRPLYETTAYALEPFNDRKLIENNEGNAKDFNSLKIDLMSNENMIVPGQKFVLGSSIFIGPERLDILNEYEGDFGKIKRYYRWGLFDFIAKLVNSLLQFLHKIIPNWGVCIILISVIIYFSMYPLTLHSMSSMKKMQLHQPEINKIRDKNKSNPQKGQQEMMEYFKKHKINPMSGCLPMLLQMPVFIGLYQVLWRSVSLKGAGFLWIKDLTEPDRLFILPTKLPFIGNEINLLPIIMVVVMVFQMRLSSKNMIVTDPAQQAQQKMMQRIMPIFLGVIFYKFSSGLTLYFTMFYVFSTFTQWKMAKVPKVV